MIGRVNHIAIAVQNLAAASAKYRDLLGASVGAPQALVDHGVTVVFIETGNTNVELLEPLGNDSPIAGFLARNPGGGMHHICFEVPNLSAASAKLVAGGARVLGAPKIGAHGRPVVFVHPKDFDGTLIELEEV
jgi:methylmalonyl-CoA/ethylmalonyl-CoA epimerase